MLQPFCSNCISGNIHSGTPRGVEEELNGLNAYIAKTADGSCDRILILGTDVFGYRFKNVRLVADEYATHGYHTIIPDLFQGDSVPSWVLSARDPTKAQKSFLDRYLLTPISLLSLVPFLIVHRHAVVQPLLEKLIAHLRLIHPLSRLGMEGFCWGGRYAITANPLLDASVACHPAMLALPAEVEAVTKPISLAVARGDHLFDVDKAEQSRTIFAKNNVPAEIEVYDDVQHGFSIRADLTDEKKKLAKEKVTEQALRWFDAHM